MIQLAYIITAYKDEKQLYRLISALNINADFFIHLDSRVNIAPFKKLLHLFPNVTFCENRYFVNWGSFAQVRSQLALLKCVFETKKAYHKVISLSGTDYPIWPQHQIEATLTSDIEFISGFNLTHCTSKQQTDKINLHHFFRDIKLNNYTLKKVCSGSARLLMSVTPFRKGLRTVINSTACDVYFGSDYWALSLECAKYVYETLEREKELMRYFRYSFVPNEMCIHTVVFNSKYSSKALLYKGTEYKGLASLTPLHHIYYNKTIKIFTEADYQTLLDSNKMFFRKAATGISDTLLNKIDQHRLSNAPNLQSNLGNGVINF